ncbi:APC family permease [Saccharopolyspora rhizosphaerae]|uniref:APC family permease n=1 Tax=Saccharopolyspora rhizosphaerae TaxID=2492662 RepID=A0A426JPB9_9PSEU|nr:amino acid permease [Saccharopolyspora rhizosphaerae]RRO14925.1 APC family permease [Saccharopolyspora rhizosphaerae]
MTRQVESDDRLTTGRDALPLALSGMVGVGVLLGPAPAAAAAGAWAPLGLLVALLAAVCAASTTAYQGSAYRGPGSAYTCVRERMGLLPARVGASAHLAAQVAAVAAIARVIGEFFLPSASALVAGAVIVLVVLATTTGLRIRGAAAWLWVALVLAVIALVVAICFAIAPVGSTLAHLDPADSADSPVGIIGAGGVLFLAFTGFERLAAPADDTDRAPWASVQRGVRTALVVVVLLVGLVIAALVHQLGWERLALSPMPIRDVLTAAAAADLVPLVCVGAAVALLPVLLGALETARSTGLALVRDGELPRVLGRTGPFGTPYLLDLITGVTAVVVSQLVDPIALLSFAACALLLHYAFANAGARLLLSDGPTWPMRGACLGMGLSVVLAMSMPISAMLTTLGVVVVGPLLAGVVSRRWK